MAASARSFPASPRTSPPLRRDLDLVARDEFYSGVALVDSSAAIALHDASDEWHQSAHEFLGSRGDLRFAALDVTTYEAYTRTRYRTDVTRALATFDFLRGSDIWQLSVTSDDVAAARARVVQLAEHRISFHDALCAAVMARKGIYRVFAFDRDFWILGCELLPGSAR